jgi:hypothetical protein
VYRSGCNSRPSGQVTTSPDSARRSGAQAATDAQRQLHALVVAAPDPLRGRLRGLTTPRLVSTCGRLHQRATWDVETAATVASLRALAHRIQLLNSEVAEHTRARCGFGSTDLATASSPRPCMWSS